MVGDGGRQSHRGHLFSLAPLMSSTYTHLFGLTEPNKEVKRRSRNLDSEKLLLIYLLSRTQKQAEPSPTDFRSPPKHPRPAEHSRPKQRLYL